MVRPGGGVIANIGVHGEPATLHLEELWIKNVTITTGLVDGTTVPLLLQLVQSGKIAAEMYVFARLRFARHDGRLRHLRRGKESFYALKVVIRR